MHKKRRANSNAPTAAAAAVAWRHHTGAHCLPWALRAAAAANNAAAVGGFGCSSPEGHGQQHRQSQAALMQQCLYTKSLYIVVLFYLVDASCDCAGLCFCPVCLVLAPLTGKVVATNHDAEWRRGQASSGCRSLATFGRGAINMCAQHTHRLPRVCFS